LWPIALLAVVLLYIFLPGIKVSTPVSLSYSQFIADAGAHKIKTVDFGNGASGSNSGSLSVSCWSRRRWTGRRCTG
jgi:hypothetical protein